MVRFGDEKDHKTNGTEYAALLYLRDPVCGRHVF
jgi:hypothetical protein